MTRWAESVLAWQAGGASKCVARLSAAVARVLEIQAQPLAAPALFDLAEAAVDAGDAAAAAEAAEQLRRVSERLRFPVYGGLAAAASA